MTVRTTHLGGTDWTAETLSSSDLNDTVSKMGVATLTSGVLTLQGTTTAFDTDFVDIAVPAGELGVNDIIKIEVLTRQAGQTKQFVIGVLDVTSTTGDVVGDGADALCVANENSTTTINIYQDKTSNDVMRLLWSGFSVTGSGPTALADEGTHDTNDANWITTAFTIRLNLRFSSSDSDTPIVYNAYVLKA